MKLRVIIIILSLMVFLSAWTGGFFYYSSIRKAALEESHRQAILHTQTINSHLTYFLQENLNTVIALAGLQELGALLLDHNAHNLSQTNYILDHFKKTYQADVCYLIDGQGVTIASSNRNATDSFVGHNYAFRPYFQWAMEESSPALRAYMALGVTSGKRGIYYSHPVYVGGQQDPLGVAVIKAPIEPLEREFVKDYDGIVMLTDPHGLIFITNRNEWILKSLSELTPDEILNIQAKRQFGPGPWLWTGLRIIDDTHAVDDSGIKYLYHQNALENYPGWKLVFLSDIDAILKRVHGPLIRSSGYLILTLCVITGLMVFFLFHTANREIDRRLKAEDALRQAHDDLERRVAERTSALTLTVDELQKEIAERRRAEEALRESEEKHRTLTENLSVGIFRSTPGAKGNYIDVNSAYMRMFGFDNKDELLSLYAYDLYCNPQDRNIFNQKMIRDGAVKNEEIVFKRKDGTPFYGSATAVAIKNEAGEITHYDGILEDITELRHAKEEARKRREELAHLGRVATMGELSASLAHELNQPLTAILSNAQAALRYLDADPVNLAEIRDILTDIVADDRRAGKVIQRLRNLFRKGEIQSAPVNINELIQEVISLITTEAMIRNVVIETRLDDRLELVSGDKIHLQQVMINFILNASDALAATVEGQRRIIIATARTPDNQVQIGVTDNGSGLAEDVLDYMIEPFYTTKPEGMGMGLSINRTIINAHGGKMWAVNNPDRGTTFYFTLSFFNEA